LGVALDVAQVLHPGHAEQPVPVAVHGLVGPHPPVGRVRVAHVEVRIEQVDVGPLDDHVAHPKGFCPLSSPAVCIRVVTASRWAIRSPATVAIPTTLVAAGAPTLPARGSPSPPRYVPVM